MHSNYTRILVLVLFFSPFVAARNFTHCLEEFRKEPDTTSGGVDSRGHLTSPANAVGLTYRTCTARCGIGAESFSWREFAQLFSSWLLPWLALISQLPFGSGNYADDFVSVIMCMGSPALVAYSLVLTALNARLVYRRAQRIKHESRNYVARALISLQQIPLELTQDERLLSFIPTNGQWNEEIIDRLNRRHAWSIATGSSVAWVVLAFGFTLIDSFVSLDSTTDGGSEGHAIGTLWLWLLCLVIGWLWVPTFTCGELKSAINRANKKTAKKAAKRIKEKATKAYNSAKTKIANRFPSPKSVLLWAARRPVVNSIPEVVEENEKGAGVIQEGTKPAGEETEPLPIPSPTHHRSTITVQAPPESQHDHDHLGIWVNPTSNQSAVSLARSALSSVHPETDRLLIPKDLGSLNRDERRLAATFNYSRIMRYLVLVDDVSTAVDKLIREKDEKKRPISEVTVQPTRNVVFPPGALVSMFKASVFALILQCGITAAAAIIVVFTPTIGLGCRSLAYVIYGGIAILILFLTIISTISARISETRVGESTAFSIKALTRSIAIILRRSCFLLAFVNATGLIVLSSLQFSSFLDNCYCNGSVTGHGKDSYIIISFEGWVPTMRTSRILATVLAAISMSIYMFFLWLVSALPKEIYH